MTPTRLNALGTLVTNLQRCTVVATARLLVPASSVVMLPVRITDRNGRETLSREKKQQDLATVPRQFVIGLTVPSLRAQCTPSL